MCDLLVHAISMKSRRLVVRAAGKDIRERGPGGSDSWSRLHDRADLAHRFAGQAQLREISSLRTEIAPEHRRSQRDEAVDDWRGHASAPPQLRHGNKPARHVLDHILVL